MRRRDAELVRHLPQTGRQNGPHSGFILSLRYQQARTGCGREGNAALELRIILPAGPLEGICPAVVEDVFALAVAFQIAGYGAEQRAMLILQEQMMAEPSGFGDGRAGAQLGSASGRERGCRDVNIPVVEG